MCVTVLAMSDGDMQCVHACSANFQCIIKGSYKKKTNACNKRTGKNTEELLQTADCLKNKLIHLLSMYHD